MTRTSPTETTAPEHVYTAITAITDALSKVGVAKGRKATSPGANYNFRGIDDIYNNLAPLLAEHSLCILPVATERQCEERQARSGGALFYVTVTVQFDLVSAIDGSRHQIVTFGEAMDSGDKATNKAMSAAYKYAAMMTFCIPTIGEDSETDTHQVAARPVMPARAPAVPASEPLSLRAEEAADKGSYHLRRLWASLGKDGQLTVCNQFSANPQLGCPRSLKERAERADRKIAAAKAKADKLAANRFDEQFPAIDPRDLSEGVPYRDPAEEPARPPAPVDPPLQPEDASTPDFVALAKEGGL